MVATKYSLAARAANDPNGSGNGRKAMLRAIEGSLRRLQTDHVDLYYLHAWDTITRPDEVMRGLDDLVSQGKVRYVGLSDVPAWYAARAQTLAEWRGFEPLCALQLEYSLVERSIEHEFPDLCAALGFGLVTWSPLAGGLLSGKYSSDAQGDLAPGRIKTTAETVPKLLDHKDARTWSIVDALAYLAAELGRPPAQVAVNWVANRAAVSSVILGATSVEQLEATMAALDFTLAGPVAQRLEEVSALGPASPYSLLSVQSPIMNKDVV